jgi:hypothetical protein
MYYGYEVPISQFPFPYFNKTNEQASLKITIFN